MGIIGKLFRKSKGSADSALSGSSCTPSGAFRRPKVPNGPDHHIENPVSLDAGISQSESHRVRHDQAENGSAPRDTSADTAPEIAVPSETEETNQKVEPTTARTTVHASLPTLTEVPLRQTEMLAIACDSFNFIDPKVNNGGNGTDVPSLPPANGSGSMSQWITTATSSSYLEDLATLQKATQYLKDGDAIAVPTETVYGLAANALDPRALAQIYAIKGRPSDNPLIVHVNSLAMLDDQVAPFHPTMPYYDRYKKLTDRFWPGPLTILLPKKSTLPTAITQSHLVAVRMPAHPIIRALLNLTGFPLAAPSANLSGRPSPTSATHVLHDLQHRVRCILDDGTFCKNGLESTVIDGTCDPPIILRHGSITLSAIRETAGWSSTISIHETCSNNSLPCTTRQQQAPPLPLPSTHKGKHEKEQQITPQRSPEQTSEIIPESVSSENPQHTLTYRPRTPGMKYRHYAPNGILELLEDSEESRIKAKVDDLLRRSSPQLSNIGLLWFQATTTDNPTKRERHISLPISNPCPSLMAHLNDIKQKIPDGTSSRMLHIFYINGKAEIYAQKLFHALRWFDDQDCQHILASPCESMHDDIGVAVSERLRKAASRM